jgi:1,4-dihydroxy-2-naphthoate polyprenyltransferase
MPRSAQQRPARPDVGAGVWVEAARPRTLPAAVAPVLVGTAAAGTLIAWRLAAALVVALAVQVAVNYANDYFDGVRGVDTPDRVGPRRAVASQLVRPQQMWLAIMLALAVAAGAGIALAAAAGWELLIVGGLAFLAALGYSGGPRPYASAGMGELFVFVFFGLVATVGSAYVQIEQVQALAVIAAVPIGLLASAILMVNNIRDITTDRAAGKHTLAVRLGATRARSAFWLMVLGAYVFPGVLASVLRSPWPLLAWASLPAILPLVRTVNDRATSADLVKALGATGRLELVYAVLLATGLALR